LCFEGPLRYPHRQPRQIPRRFIPSPQELRVNVLNSYRGQLTLYPNHNVTLQHQPPQRPVMQRLRVQTTPKTPHRRKIELATLSQLNQLVSHNHRPLYPRCQLSRTRQPPAIPRQSQRPKYRLPTMYRRMRRNHVACVIPRIAAVAAVHPTT